jgi:hypothetical protein
LAKALKTAALVVGAVALVATGIGAAAGVGIGLGLTAGTLGTIASVAAIAGVASGVLSVAVGLTAKKPVAQATGSQTQFAADPDAGIPLAIGRTGTAGNIIARLGWDTRDAGDNDRQTFVSVLSLGPVKEIEPALGVDRVPVYFDGQGRAIGGFAGFMWRTTQVGLLASAALSFGAGAGSPPVWGAQHALSGKAATTWTLRFDTKSKLYQNGVPAPMNVVKGQFCYDPRKDSTYPGGSGPHRMADPADRAAYDAAVATWEFSECPFLNGLRFVHGYWQRDMANPASSWQRVMGMGAPLAGIDLASFVEGANVADANGWKAGGVIFSGDDKWASLKVILQAGMGEPLALGAKISCLVNSPKVSLATITEDDVVGECSVGATQPRRDRVNTITPKFRLEENGWQLLPGAPISVAEHVAADRGKRSRAQEYRMIQSASQAGTAVRYDIENAREFGPIVLPCKLFWMGYKPGDCVTANLPEIGLNGQPILLLNRALAPSSGIVTLTARSETPGKHAFALGQTATPPPTPGVTGAPIVPVPTIDAWAVTGGSVAADGVTLAALTITGAVTASAIDGVIFDYRPFVSGQADEAGWIAAGTEAVDATRKVITGVRDLALYEVSVRYSARGFTSGRRLIGPVTTGAATVSWGDGVVGAGKPEDNATVGAPVGTKVGDRPVTNLLSEVDQTLAAIDALEGIYGDTASAAASAEKASLSERAAAASERAVASAQAIVERAKADAEAAFTAADAARGDAVAKAFEAAASAGAANSSASTAEGHKNEAAEKATAAQGSASAASTSAGNASASEGRAASSERSAASASSSAAASERVAASSGATRGLTPNGTFSAGNVGWTASGLSYGNWWQGAGYRTPTGVHGSLASDTLVPVDPSRKYRLNTKVTVHGVAQATYVGLSCYDTGKNFLGNIYMPQLLPHVVAGGSVLTISNEYTGEGATAPAYGHGGFFVTGTAYVQPIALLNYPEPAPIANGITDIAALFLEDITSEREAGRHADAASSSASTASTKAGEASQSASASKTSENNASTSAGSASTSASSAATSERNAAGSSSNAAESSRLAALSEGAAGRSVSAAATSASTATTKAGEAGDSATASNTSATNASTSAGQASSSAGAAAGSAGAAAGSAGSAGGSAGAAAGSARDALASASTASTHASNASRDAASAYSYSLTSAGITEGLVGANGEVTRLKATVAQNTSAIATLDGDAAARWIVESVAGSSRAQISVFAKANGGAGVDIVGDTTFRGKLAVGLTASGPRTVITDTYTMYVAGPVMSVYGLGFGDRGQFLEWVGPTKSALGQCSEGDAIRYVRTDGTAYFGGALNAGTITNPASTSVTNPDASITTGLFGSNGRRRTVTVSLSSMFRETIYNACPANVGQPRVTVDLFKGTDAGGEFLATFEFGGYYGCDPGYGTFEPGSISEQFSQSATYTDDSGGVNVAYFARLRGMVRNETPQQQGFGIISVEQ